MIIEFMGEGCLFTTKQSRMCLDKGGHRKKSVRGIIQSFKYGCIADFEMGRKHRRKKNSGNGKQIKVNLCGNENGRKINFLASNAVGGVIHLLHLSFTIKRASCFLSIHVFLLTIPDSDSGFRGRNFRKSFLSDGNDTLFTRADDGLRVTSEERSVVSREGYRDQPAPGIYRSWEMGFSGQSKWCSAGEVLSVNVPQPG